MTGTVYIVGAGPGDPGLFTLRGQACLAAADVVVHDHLVPLRLLAHARPGAELIGVGNPHGDPVRLSQAAIGALLIERARAGRTVVRLKNGDPMLFGRGGEEIRALADAGVPFEVVPGVTSALSVPAYAGIPATQGHPDLSGLCATMAHPRTLSSTRLEHRRFVVARHLLSLGWAPGQILQTPPLEDLTAKQLVATADGRLVQYYTSTMAGSFRISRARQHFTPWSQLTTVLIAMPRG